MANTITAKVAAVADETTLVLNAGTQNGVREGMVFAIVAEQQEVVDPDSGESLGNWEVVKARVVVEHVQERMCTVRSPLKPGVDASGTLSTQMVRHSYGLYSQDRAGRTGLEVHQTGLLGKTKPRPIQVGDLARSIAVEPSPLPTPDGDDNPTAPDLPSGTYAMTATEEEQSSGTQDVSGQEEGAETPSAEESDT